MNLDVVDIQSVRMKSIQNKKNYISEPNCHIRMRQLVTFG
jgi:hypothetical protein